MRQVLALPRSEASTGAAVAGEGWAAGRDLFIGGELGA